MVVLPTDCEALTVYVPAPPVPVPKVCDDGSIGHASALKGLTNLQNPAGDACHRHGRAGEIDAVTTAAGGEVELMVVDATVCELLTV
jgi:hypothetical protein